MANIALYPGGYKPPHIGHYEAAKEALKEADKVIVFVGPKEREGITQDISVQLWKLYTKNDPIEIRKAGTSPVKDVYDFVELEAEDGDTLSFIKGEKDSEDPRFARIPTYAEKFGKNIITKSINIKDIKSRSDKSVSGTSMRNYIKNNDKESFIDGLPLGIDEEQAWSIATGLEEISSWDGKSSKNPGNWDGKPSEKQRKKPFPAIGEDLYDPNDHYRDFAKTNDPNPKKPTPNNYKYRDGGLGKAAYRKRSFLEDAQFEKGKVLHVYDFDDTITQVKTNIKTIITSPNDSDFYQELNISSEEFPEKSKELEARLGHLDITYDFSEFDKQIEDAIINSKVVNKLKNSLSRADIKTTILTARTIGHPVTRYLKDELGLSAYVVPLGLQKGGGRVTGKDKANWIEDHIKKGYQTIYFIDDSEENRVEVSGLKDKYPDIILKVENPAEVSELMYGTMTKQEKAKHAKNLKRLKQDLKKQGNQYMEVPNYLKGTLRRKLYENTAVIHDEFIPLEVMDTPELQVQGMMGRNKLKGGMVFPYDNVDKREFHMQNCKIPLDIVFLDNNKINKIDHSAPPCKGGWCPKYSGKADTVLELPGGYCKKHNVNVGDHIGINLYELPKIPFLERKLSDKEERIAQDLPDKEFKKRYGKDWKSVKIATATKMAKKEGMYPPYKADQVQKVRYQASDTFTNSPKQAKKRGYLQEKDPKKGTGKKPKGSGRRLYTDENPKDTVKVKFSTRQDIVDTLTKKSFKSKSHKRQSQIINLIHQRVRAALSRTKDPQKKKRLKSAFEYIKKRKEASKRKTKRMRKESALTKGWWKNIINEILLLEGGAAGHMAHPFNLSSVNSGKDLKDIFNKSAESLSKNPGSVKIDGVNSSIRLVDIDGKKQFVMDRGSKKPLDVKGITKADLEDRFKPGHGMIKVGGEVLDMFNEALPSLEADLKKLGAWEDPDILFNMEYVSGKTNVQKYDNNFIAIHGLNKIEMKEVQGKRGPLIKRSSTEISYDKSALQSMLDNLKPIAEKNDFEVYGSVPTEMSKKPNFGAALSKTYTIKSNEGDKTQSLDAWLNELNDIPEKDFIFIYVNDTKKKVGAVSKQVYTTLLQGGNIDELFESEDDKKKAVEGFVTYLATEKLGDEILKVLDSPMGSVENHEGVVIRDKNITTEPFKITGKFILGGMTSDF